MTRWGILGEPNNPTTEKTKGVEQARGGMVHGSKSTQEFKEEGGRSLLCKGGPGGAYHSPLHHAPRVTDLFPDLCGVSLLVFLLVYLQSYFPAYLRGLVEAGWPRCQDA